METEEHSPSTPSPWLSRPGWEECRDGEAGTHFPWTPQSKRTHCFLSSCLLLRQCM